MELLALMVMDLVEDIMITGEVLVLPILVLEGVGLNLAL